MATTAGTGERFKPNRSAALRREGGTSLVEHEEEGGGREMVGAANPNSAPNQFLVPVGRRVTVAIFLAFCSVADDSDKKKEAAMEGFSHVQPIARISRYRGAEQEQN